MRLVVVGGLVAIALFSITLPSAYAITLDEVQAKWFWQDLKENFVGFFSSEWREEAIVKHIAENQMYAESLKASGTDNIDIIEERITNKQIDLQAVIVDGETVFQKIDRPFHIFRIIEISHCEFLDHTSEVVLLPYPQEFLERR